MMNNYDLRKLCIENDWFTCGTNDQYEKLFQMNESQQYSVSQIAFIIWFCSEDKDLTEIEIKLAEAGM